MSSVRRPPLPHWNCTYGTCRWCGQTVFKKDGVTPNPRALWHKPCVEVYKLATRSATQRQRLWRRDKGKCAKCGIVHDRHGAWASDHTVPLFSVDRSLPWSEVIFFWSMGNLQTLCMSPCHDDKSRSEMRAYHANRKSASVQAA